jgi:hypothetical protein
MRKALLAVAVLFLVITACVHDDTKIIMDGDLRTFTLYDDNGQEPYGFITGKADCERFARVNSTKGFNLHCELGIDPRAPKAGK